MLEPWTHDQAHGLQAWELRPPTRVLPVVVSSADSRSLELLWRLEQAFQALTLPVVVVEGVRGLHPRDATAGHRAVLRRWLKGVPAGSVVLLHAPLEALTVLLADSEARPLVPLDATPVACVQAYNAVKVLHEAAALAPVVVSLLPAPVGGAEAPRTDLLNQAARTLQDTCQQRLGWVPVVWPLEYHFGGAEPLNGGVALAGRLKLLDSALILDDLETRSHDDTCHQRSPILADQTIGASDVQRQRHA